MALSKILLSDNLTELTGVKSVVYKEVTSADVNIHGGCVCSASIEVEVYGSQATAVSAGDVVYYYQYDKNNTATLVGIFNCEPVIETKTSYKFVAYDNAQKLKADFSQWLQANQSNFPMTVYALVSAACTVAGVTLGSASWGLSTQSVQAFYTEGITCRDILSYAAEIGCCFVRCHTDGNVYFDWFTSNANTIAPSVGTGQYAYKADGLTYANYTTAALDRVAVHPSGEDDVAYIYPTLITSGNTLHIQNNLLLTGADAAFYNAVAQQVYTVMSALGTYRPMTANLFVKENPFRAGDIVSVTDSQSVTFTSVITALTVSESGAVLESTGNETYDEGTGNSQKAITQLASDVVRINKLKVDWADINTAIINYLTANNVTAQNLTIVDEYGNVIATFDANGIVLGNPSTTHAELDYNSFELYDRSGNKYLDVGDARTNNNPITVTETFIAQPSQVYFTLGYDISDFSQFTATVNGASPSGSFTQGLLPNRVIYNTGGGQNLQIGDVVKFTYPTLDPIYHYVLGTRTGALGAFATSNGKNSTASGSFSVIGGGYGNKASGGKSVVSGGESNTASGTDSSIGGGQNNVASGLWSTIAGGCENDATASQSFIGGGYGNQSNDINGVVCGGIYNNASSSYECAFIGGGRSNTASGRYSVVDGGQSNTASGAWATVGGGDSNTASGDDSAIGGGKNNTASGANSTVSGGAGNTASGYNATVPGGINNTANHRSQVVFGEYNVLDPSTAASTARGNYVEIVGNGTANNARSNARTLDWSGNETLSGGLTAYIELALKNMGYAIGDAISANTSRYLIAKDKNDATMGWLRSIAYTSNLIGFELSPERVVNGTAVYNILGLRIDANGNRSVILSAPAEWRSALGLGTSGALPITIAQGGTGQTAVTSVTTASSIVTAASGFTVDSAEYKQWGKVAMINIVFKKTTAVTSATSMSPGTIVSGKRPATISSVVSSDPTLHPGAIATGGSINIYGTWAANGTKRIMATYLLP